MVKTVQVLPLIGVVCFACFANVSVQCRRVIKQQLRSGACGTEYIVGGSDPVFSILGDMQIKKGFPAPSNMAVGFQYLKKKIVGSFPLPFG